ncbi:MAG: TRAP transporter large permease, partial [Candidatus Pacebacteria bacterium]|nr:TRAP transporter large permease [Candidatus Paceibacterota bacterium]
MTPLQIGLLGLAVLLVLLMSSIPVGFVMALVGMVGFAVILGDPHAAMSMAASDLFNTFANYSLTVIPLFVFMGQIAFHAGISRRLFDSAHCWFGALRGGLAMATVGACTIFGAICGSGPATAATMSAVALPEMKRYGYSMELGTGAVAAGGSIGMLIPPSVVFIVYGVMSEQSVGKLFMAGIVPGILIAVLFCLTILIMCKRRPELAPDVQGMPWPAKFKSLLGTGEAIVLFALVIGGLFKGIFTPTEAAAIGAAGVIVLAILRRQLTWHGFIRALLETARTSCMVMFIVAGAVIFGHFLAVTRIPFELAAWLGALPLPRWCIVGCIIFFFL